MAESKQLPKRDEVPVEKTWDLTTIFKSDEEWEKAYDLAAEKVAELPKFQGTLADGADQLLKVLEAMHEAVREVEVVYVYAHLKTDQDTGNNTYQAMSNRAMTLITNASAATAWFDPELLT